MIRDFEQHVAGRELVMIIEGWEKVYLQGHTRLGAGVDSLYIVRLGCRKVIVISLLAAGNRFQQQNALHCHWLFHPAAKGQVQSEMPIEKSQALSSPYFAEIFRQVLAARIAAVDGAPAVSEEAIETALTFSGGNIRQFLQVMSGAAATAGRLHHPTIEQVHVMHGVDRFGGVLEMVIYSNPKHAAIMEELKQGQIPASGPDRGIFESLLHHGLIMYNPTHQRSVFPNPLIDTASTHIRSSG
jgi:hypothetical protein